MNKRLQTFLLLSLSFLSLSADPIKRDKCKDPVFFAGASYTYWVPYQEYTNIGYSDGEYPAVGDYLMPRFLGRSGFKACAGVRLFDGWSLTANYTWFYHYPGFSESVLVDGISTYNSPYSYAYSENSIVNYTSFTSKFTTYFNRVDGYLDREYFLGGSFRMRPWIGFLGAFDTQHFSFDALIDGETSSDVFRFKQSWWGVGPYSGACASFNLIESLNVFIKPGIALLLADHDVTNLVRERASDDTFSDPTVNTYHSFSNIETMVETRIGLDFCIEGDHINFAFEAMWETQTYFSHAGYLWNFSPSGQMGNFSMQGVTAGVKIGF